MTTPEPGVVVIRSREVWDKLCAVEQAVNDIAGSVRLLVERSDRTDADVRQLREDHDREIAALRAEVEELKKRRMPLPVIGALTTVGALCASVIGLIITQ